MNTQFGIRRFIVLVSSLASLLSACISAREAEKYSALSPSEVAAYLPNHVDDRSGWASDISAAIEGTNKVPTAERVCAVIAVIEQESGYSVNPAVPDLPKIVRDGLEQKLERLGILAGPTLKLLLRADDPTGKPYSQRIERLRTERDLDLLVRDLAATFRGKVPRPLELALGDNVFDRLNPVTTAGSMQVKVGFASAIAELKGLTDHDVRDLLYTRAWGIRAGTLRLLGYEARYDDIIYRFADYNAGLYASRNAAFQASLAALTGMDLVLDGDLMAYDEDSEFRDEMSATLKAMLVFGRSHDMWDWTVRRHFKQEKTSDFEETNSWKLVNGAIEKRTGKAPPYARIPALTLTSPKLSQPKTTAWFATNVKRRYEACRKRGASG